MRGASGPRGISDHFDCVCTQFLSPPSQELLRQMEKLQAASSADRIREEGAVLVERVRASNLLEERSLSDKIRLLTAEGERALVMVPTMLNNYKRNDKQYWVDSFGIFTFYV